MIRDNILSIQKNINDACIRSGRKPEEVTLIAVSKTKPIEMIKEASSCGIVNFGENKVQEILVKEPLMPDSTRWHMIGHLQTNKVRAIIDKTVLIHSVDSVKLAAQIESEAERLNMKSDILLEINAAEEESKYGFLLNEAEDAIMKIKDFSHINIRGLMTVAPFTVNPEENRQYFKKLYKFYIDMNCKNIDNVNMNVLSMGMTGDYEIAVEEGSTMVRIGTGIFGTR